MNHQFCWPSWRSPSRSSRSSSASAFSGASSCSEIATQPVPVTLNFAHTLSSGVGGELSRIAVVICRMVKICLFSGLCEREALNGVGEVQEAIFSLTALEAGSKHPARPRGVELSFCTDTSSRLQPWSKS